MASRRALITLSLFTLVGCGELPLSSRRQAITDGVQESGHRAVGYLEAGDSVGCTGTLVGRRTVLTAGHCISAGAPQTFVVEGARYTSSSSTIHPKYDPTSHDNDVGVLILARGVHVVPTAVATIPRPVGQKITLVGFGATAQDAGDVGTKRSAVNTIESLHPTSFNFAGSGAGEGNVCHKDSGGPVYVNAGTKGTGPQLGIAIGGEKPCGTRGIAMRADVYVSWLRSTSGGDLAVEGEKVGYGLPCADGDDCTSGLCASNGAGGDRYCSAACGTCPEGAPCLDAGGGKRVCGLPAPPEDEEGGCAVRPGRSVRPGCFALVLGLLVLLGSTRSAATPLRRSAPPQGRSPDRRRGCGSTPRRSPPARP